MSDLVPAKTYSSDELEAIADILFEYMRDMIYDSPNAYLDTDKLPKEFENVGYGLTFLFEKIVESKDFAHELASGNINTEIPPADNAISAPLKKLHSSFSHLSWQAQQVANGDYSQRVDFMGDFADAFNNMIIQLDEQHKSNIAEKENLLKAIDEITALQKSLEYVNQAQSAFLATMSHEIRTPMNAVLGMADLALREDMSLTVRDYLNTIRQAGVNILSIINDILDFSKIESGSIDIVEIDYHLSALINDVIHIVKDRAYKSNLRFIVNVDNNLPNELTGDSKRIRQVLLNVLSNAVKYTEKGSVSFLITGTKTDENNVTLTIRITDSGIGISKKDIAVLFEKFTRFDQEKNVNVEGSGLGLSIVKGILESMNGTIDVESIVGEGTTFIIELNQKVRSTEKIAFVANSKKIKALIFERRQACIDSIVQTMEGLDIGHKNVTTTYDFFKEIKNETYTHIFLSSVLYERVKSEFPEIKTKAKLVLITEYGETVSDPNVRILTTPIFSIPIANLFNEESNDKDADMVKEEPQIPVAPDVKVLSVDDTRTNLIVFQGFLKPYLVQVTSCMSGPEAIEILKKEHFDIIFLDYMMPEMNGIQTLNEIKSMVTDYPYLEKIPVISLSANAMLGADKMFIESGFDDYLSKPINVSTLHDLLIKWIPQHKWSGGNTDSAETTEPPETSDITECWGRAPERPVPEIDIRGINTKKGLSVSGSVKDYLYLLSIFLGDGLDRIKEIKSSYEENNIPLFVIYVHALKSASANIGADKLSGFAKTLEDAGNDGNIDYINEHITQLIFDYKELLNDINAFLIDNRGDNSEPVNIDEIKDELKLLRKAIDEFNSAVISDTTNVLRDYATPDTDTGKVIEEILKNVLNGDDDEAISLIDSLL